MLVAGKRLDIGHRIVSVSLFGTAPLPRSVELSYFEPREVGLLRRLKSHPLGKIDARRPFDCPDRRKPTEQILGQMLKIGSRNWRWPSEGSLQLLQKDLLLGKPGIYLV